MVTVGSRKRHLREDSSCGLVRVVVALVAGVVFMVDVMVGGSRENDTQRANVFERGSRVDGTRARWEGRRAR